jgi:hypothetical protein
MKTTFLDRINRINGIFELNFKEEEVLFPQFQAES